MDNSIEKVKECYVLSSVDSGGNTIYLKYLLKHNWELTTDIEQASKMLQRDFAEEVLHDYYYDNCYYDMGGTADGLFVIVPLKITWELIKETD